MARNLLLSQYYLKNTIKRLEVFLRQLIKPKEEMVLEQEIGKMAGIYYDSIMYINEMMLIDTSMVPTYKLLLLQINSYISQLESVKSFEELKKNGEETYSFLSTTINTDKYLSVPEYYNEYFLKINNDKELIDKAFEVISPIDREFNVLQTECEEGTFLTRLKRLNDKALTYGTEQRQHKLKAAKKENTKIVKGSLIGSRISNGVFDINIIMPNIYYDMNNNMKLTSITKKERTYIQDNLRYVRNGGIVLISLPIFRLHSDTCLMLSKQLENVDYYIYKGKDFSFVNIIGQKNLDKDGRQEVYDKLRGLYNSANEEKNTFTLEKKLKIPSSFIPVEIFKGSEIDEDEIMFISENSGAYSEFIKSQEVEKLSETQKRPLLPFNIGQIGLVLTSGSLDGIIDEGDGNYHLVKGRVSKKVDSDRVVSDNKVEETEIISNRVEINIMLPDGEFKTLT